MIEQIVPTDENHWHQLRAECVTSSEVAALFDLSPYTTKFEYWHRKKDKLIDVRNQDSEHIRWGKRLERVIAEGVAEENGWQIRPMPEFIFDTDRRVGSSFDFSIEQGPVIADGKGVLEVKNVFGPKFKEGWVLEDGTIEAPPYIEIQMQNELSLSGRKWGYISALVSGNQLMLLKRERDEMVITKINEAVDKFWWSIKNDQAPTPDFGNDGEFITRLYTQSEAGLVINKTSDPELWAAAQSYRDASATIKEAEERKKIAKAQILMNIGGAEKVVGNGFTISAKTVAGGQVESFYRRDYRGFRINFK